MAIPVGAGVGNKLEHVCEHLLVVEALPLYGVDD